MEELDVNRGNEDDHRRDEHGGGRDQVNHVDSADARDVHGVWEHSPERVLQVVHEIYFVSGKTNENYVCWVVTGVPERRNCPRVQREEGGGSRKKRADKNKLQ